MFQRSTYNPAPPKLGRFRIATDLLRNNWDELAIIMCHMVVVSVSYNFDNDSNEYTAYSQLFDTVPKGHIPPLYDIIFIDEPNTKGFRLEKQK